ncbi:hypothetical protein niasHT_029733 [Heterodera trifolii]|uniref:Uncharacterized protein n=1 Tax=Heterodera trifolii TaxID=157864 RepID=A0ABD2KR53_9BILA
MNVPGTLLTSSRGKKEANALNCKSFSPEEAKFAVENFHQIDLVRRNDEKAPETQQNQNADDGASTSKKESSRKIVELFVDSLRENLSDRNENEKTIDSRTIEKNGRKMITMATDFCNRLPTEGENVSSGYLHCVQFLLYHHMQKLVWRLENKWGIISDQNNDENLEAKNHLLQIYTDKKMIAWEQMVKTYGKELKDLTEVNELIRRKFEFCLIIEGETQYERNWSKKAELIGTNIFNSLRKELRKDEQLKQNKGNEDQKEKAKIMAKNWKLAETSMRVRIQVLVNTAERKCRTLPKKPFRQIQKLGRNLSKRLERSWSSKNSEIYQNEGGTESENSTKKPFQNLQKFGRSISKRLDRSMSLNSSKMKESAKNGERKSTDGTTRRENKNTTKNPLRNFQEFGRSISKRLERPLCFKNNEENVSKTEESAKNVERKPKEKVSKTEQSAKKSKTKESAKNGKRKPQENVCKTEESAKNGETKPNDETTMENDNGLDELRSSFVTCIYHYMYAFSQNLVTKTEGKNGQNSDNKNFKEIYENLREKTRKRMKLAFYAEGVMEMDKWLNEEKTPSQSTTVEEDENEDEAVHDPFRNCANVVEGQVDEDTVVIENGGLMNKSFDEFLFQCAGQFIEAVAEEQFSYKLFVNLNTMQLDNELDFPPSMKDETMASYNNGQNARDKCFMMRELLKSLNKNLAHRLNFEKITSKNEKERWTMLHQKLENLRLENIDNRWMHRTGTKLSHSYQNFVRDFRKWKAKGTLYHPIRDGIRKVRHDMGSQKRKQSAETKLYKAQTMRRRRRKRTDGAQILERQKTLGELMNEERQLRISEFEFTNTIVAIRCLQEEDETSSSEQQQTTKTLGELFDEDHFEAPQIVMEKIERKMEKIRQKIAQESLGKRLKDYEMFIRAFYIALAFELFERMHGEEGAMTTTNWHFVLGSDEEAKLTSQKQAETDKLNVERIKKKLKVFDEILKRMGKMKTKAKPMNIKFWSKSKKEEASKSGDGETEETDKSSGGIGYELRYLGYTTEKDGEQLLELLQDEMKLNLDQFTMSYDGQCDLTNDLNDCFVASDGIDFDAQVEKVSLFGKETSEMSTLEKAAESLFKKLNRWSYKFGQKGKRHRNMLKRYFSGKIKDILGVIPELMTDKVSPFELVIPFYLPMKKGIKFVFKKVLVQPKDWFRAWILKLFSTANFVLNDGDEKMKQKANDGGKVPITDLSEIEPSINVPNFEESLNENLGTTIKKMSNIVDKKKANSNEKGFKKVAQMLKDLFINFGLKKVQNEIEKSVGNAQNNSGENGNTKKSNRRRRKRGIELGAGINAYIEAGKQGSSTASALLIDAKVMDWSLTSPMPGLHFHWLHIGHPIMLGKLNIAASMTTGILVIFIIVGMLYWWHALKLAVYLSIQKGDLIGWVVIFLAAVFYILFCVGFVML